MTKLSVPLFCILLVFSVLQLVAQKETQTDLIQIQDHSDCHKALMIRPSGVFGPTNAPIGNGEILEIQGNNKKDTFFFEKEHNTVWYKFVAVENTLLEFSVEPISIHDDYDFLLFQVDDKNYCEQIIHKKLKPIRSNISRNDISIESKTGISSEAAETYVPSGPGPDYSKAVFVKKGETYLLVLDNVYPNGSGHRIRFNSQTNIRKGSPVKKLNNESPPKTVKGKLVDTENTASIEADIKLQELPSGKIIAETKSNESTGEFELNWELDIKKQYLLIIEPVKNYFFMELKIDPYRDHTKLKNGLVLNFEKMKKGRLFRIENILFYGDSPELLPVSKPCLDRLLMIMKRNKKLKISIEGHTNGCHHSVEFAETLSKNRAKTVYDYLTSKGIDSERLEAKGFGCRHMLHKETMYEPLARLNRRVEIRILEN